MQITRDIPSYFKKQDKYLIVYHRHHNSVRAGNARFMCIDDMPLDENGEDCNERQLYLKNIMENGAYLWMMFIKNGLYFY
jgi:hypothetical protein